MSNKIKFELDALILLLLFASIAFAQNQEYTCSSPKGQCSGTESCTVDIEGNVGEKVQWQSSCGGNKETTIDGQNENIEFNCAQTALTTGDNNPPIGWLDIANCEFMRGWALDLDAKDVSVKVHLYKDGGANADPSISGTFIREHVTSEMRPDVNVVYETNNPHGFIFPTPSEFIDRQPHTVYVHGIDSTQDPTKSSLLSGLPKSITCTNDNSLIQATTFRATDLSGNVISAIAAGGSARLQWTAASSVIRIKITDHIGNVKFESSTGSLAAGSHTETITASTTYILTASYPSGDVNKHVTVNIGQGTTDNTPPIRSNGQPQLTASGTPPTTISLATDEVATCRYSTTPNVQYSSMSSTFSTTGSSFHSQTLSGLATGITYNYYVRCIDGAGNSNTDDFTISFRLGGAQTCAAQNGFICTEENMCAANTISSSDTTRCCSATCVTPSWNSCSQCGNGWFNLCDRAECNSISQGCYFIPTTVSGNCYACAGKTCQDYTTQAACTENHCSIDSCSWNGNSCATQTTTLTLEQQAQLIGSMYNCPEEKPNMYNVLGNIGYSFSDDELIYAYANLLNEKGCHKGNEKYVIFYVSTVNFPVNGRAEGQGSDAEQKWLEYWSRQTQRFSDLGYKIIIHPMYFIINDNSPNLDYASGLRPLIRSDLNIAQNQIPVVFRCRASDTCIRGGQAATGDACYTPLASVYDPKTFDLAASFYNGIKNHFSQYPAFTKISITAPSDFGEYGFPFGIEGRWWNNGAYLGQTANSLGCYTIGDSAVPATITTQNFNQPLNDYMQRLATHVKNEIFPGKRYMVFMGYGNDVNPRDGFSYANVVNWAQSNGIELHSTHAVGADWVEEAIGKITSARTPNSELTFENDFSLNENIMTKILYHSSKYGVTGFQPNTQYMYDLFYLNHLMYSMGPSGNPSRYQSKGIAFDLSPNGLSALRSLHLTNGEMQNPSNGATINGDSANEIKGWAYFNSPYDDRQRYGVKIYAGHLMENPQGAGVSQPKHPEYMRLVGSTITQYEREAGRGDTSGFKFNWKPNMASGQAVLRIYLVNGDSQIIAEHPRSPLIVNIQSRITGSATLARNNYAYPGNMCARSFTMSGTATDSQRPGQNLNVVIIDEYRGRILAQGTTNGNLFSISFTVPSTQGEETQVITPRAYVNTGTDLIALQTSIVNNGLEENPIINKFGNSLVNCQS